MRPAPGSTASSRWRASTAPRWCARASTRRARPARPSGSCGRPRPIHDIAVDRYGLEPGDLFFDPLALTLGTGMEESRGDGVATLEGIKLIKEQLPGVHTTLGLSNISFGLNPAARHALNSVYLHEAAQAGPRLGHRPRRPHHAAGADPRRAEAGVPRRDLRPAHRRLRPAPGAPVDVRGRQRLDGREGGPLRLAHRAAPVHPHHRGRPRRPHRRSRRRPRRRPLAAGDHQRHPPRAG